MFEGAKRSQPNLGRGAEEVELAGCFRGDIILVSWAESEHSSVFFF